MDSQMTLHNGGCHCGRVRWLVKAPSSVVAWKCNCSDCSMRGNIHFIVPSERFELLGDSKQNLTTYTFGTHTAKHTFCKEHSPMLKLSLMMGKTGKDGTNSLVLLHVQRHDSRAATIKCILLSLAVCIM
ncbi:centromere protein V isoform X3 [Ricinus communis]|uniref:centromere protein V isoform X3 n=1 Tax=Ricinus communis TaxID=3988 RepID=UPI00201ACD46|nr:centromere protein V isoform X3 [Ricinus communis]